MNGLIRLAIFACASLCLRGDDNANGTGFPSPRRQHRLATSDTGNRQALKDFNLFRRNTNNDHSVEEHRSHHGVDRYYSSAEQDEAPDEGKGKGRSKTSRSKGKGKGKGKSSKSSMTSSKKKSSLKKSSKSSHSIKKKKQGKGKMNHVSGKGHDSGSFSHSHSSKHISGKGKGKGDVHGNEHENETVSPVSFPHGSPSLSPEDLPTSSSPNDSPSMNMPTSPTNSVPTFKPSAAPTPLGETLQLSEFVLAYTFEREEIPSDSDVQAAVALTSSYLNGFSKQRLDELKEIVTRQTISEAPIPPSPHRIGFQSTAFFTSGTNPLPTVGEMDLLVTLAFSGENLRTYIGLLGQLPESNIFSTTTDVSDSSSRSRDVAAKKSNVAIGASAGAGVFIALLIGVVFYRQRSTYVELDKITQDGHITVAGETYFGTSTMYSASEAGGGILNQDRTCDEVQSMWGISTKAGTEDCASEGGEPMEFGEDTLEHQLGDFSSYAHLLLQNDGPREDLDVYRDDPLAPDRERWIHLNSDKESGRTSHNMSSDEGTEAEDGDVPLRVVDLIRRFTPLSR